VIEEGRWDQFIPDVGMEERKVLEGGLEIISDLGIVEAYRRWCGKSDPSDGARTESIMVSCPKPDHPDKIPSAWLNSEKNVYYCGACAEGGDIMDLAAIRFGYPIPGYKKGRSFPELIEVCLVDLGYDVEEMKTTVRLELAELGETMIAEVFGVVDPEYDEVYPEYELDWKDYAPEDTFLHKWMVATDNTTIPDEFRLFLGFQMLSAAVGQRVRFQWGETEVRTNSFVAYMGDTGSGKSRAINLAKKLVREVSSLKFDPEDPTTKGVKHLSRPGSGEALVDLMSWLPPGAAEPQSVNGWASMDELAELMTASTRRGSTLREVLISMYDGHTSAVSSRGHGDSLAVDPFYNLSVGAQPEAMSSILGSNDVASGFTNRFMYVKGTPKPYIPFAELTPVNFGSLARDLNNTRAWSESKPMMYLDIHATVAVDDHLLWLQAKAKEGELFARLQNHFLKLALLLAVNCEDPSMGVHTLDQARKLVEFLMPTTKMVDSEASVSNVNQLIAHIEKMVGWWPGYHGEFATQTKVHNRLPVGKKKDRDLFDQTFDALIRRGRVVEAPPDKREAKRIGRPPAKRYMLADPTGYGLIESDVPDLEDE